LRVQIPAILGWDGGWGGGGDFEEKKGKAPLGKKNKNPFLNFFFKKNLLNLF